MITSINDKLIFTIMGVGIPLFVLLPILRVARNIVEPHSLYFLTLLQSDAIIRGVGTTIELIIKVGALSSIIGFLLAFVMTFYHIPYRRVVNILLILPLGIPVYVAAYTYSNIFHHLSFLETILRSSFLLNGSVFIYAFFLYPYVYLASKSYLHKNLTEYIEVAKTLGQSHLQTFFRVVLPLSRPVIVGSALFVLFETLSDFAVVEFYGVLTLSRYVNLAWFSNGDFISASKFSIYILFIMFVLIFVEKISRRNKHYSSADTIHRPIQKETLQGTMKWIVYGSVLSVILLSTIIPITQMVISMTQNLDFVERLDVFVITWNSLRITLISIAIIVVAGLLLSTITIYLKGIKKQVLSSVSTVGYIVPSMVLALGIYIVFIRIDQWLYKQFYDVGLDVMVLTSTITIVIIAFFIKFFSIAYSNFLSAYGKINYNMLEASETLGETKLSTLFTITIPLLRKSIIAVSIILFIDMFKELTLVYSLRPFNFKTLSTEVYRYAGNEMINVAAFPSLIIVILCALLITYLEEGLKS
jgi:iron(III) transport system permease protein